MKASAEAKVISDLFGDNDNDPRFFWVGLPLEKLPVSAAAARDVGCRFFYSGIECSNGHLAPKYTVGNRCVMCAHIAAKGKRDKAGAGSGKTGAARAHMVRALAALDGQKTYVPSRPCKHGHWLRWVGTNNCIECEEARKTEYAAARRETRLVKKYDLTAAQYDELSASQGKCCKVCKEEPTDSIALHVDHCHDTGAVRGLLCSKCNQAIGLMRDNPTILRAAAEYIENAKA